MSGRNYGFIRKHEAKKKREKQYQMVLDLGPLLEHPPKGIVHDTSLLPHSKSELVDALLEFIKTAQSPHFINICEVCLVELTNYQDGVGEKSITMLELPEEFDSQAVKKAFAASGFDRWSEFSESITAELADFGQRMAEAKNANLHLQPAWKKAWQKFRRQGLYSPFYEGYDFP